jgi:hypothetical protein
MMGEHLTEVMIKKIREKEQLEYKKITVFKREGSEYFTETGWSSK